MARYPISDSCLTERDQQTLDATSRGDQAQEIVDQADSAPLRWAKACMTVTALEDCLPEQYWPFESRDELGELTDGWLPNSQLPHDVQRGEL